MHTLKLIVVLVLLQNGLVCCSDKETTSMVVVENPTSINTNAYTYQRQKTEEVVGLVYDADCNSYETIKIGSQVWMAENLRTTTCNNGSKLQVVEMGKTLVDGGLYWHNNNANSPESKEYGPIYNWGAIKGCDICPKDFKIPTRREWHKLIRFWYGRNDIDAGIPGLTYASYKLREPGNRLWSKNFNDTISSVGFCAKPGGWLEDGEMQFFLERTGWWGKKSNLPHVIKIADGDGGVWGADATPEYAMYVRCLKYK